MNYIEPYFKKKRKSFIKESITKEFGKKQAFKRTSKE